MQLKQHRTSWALLFYNKITIVEQCHNQLLMTADFTIVRFGSLPHTINWILPLEKPLMV